MATVRFGRDAVLVDANEAAVALAGESLIGEPLSAVRPSDQVDDPEWLWRTIERMGAVTSVGRMRRFDGSEIEIEFHAASDGDADFYVSHWRRVTVASASDQSLMDAVTA